MMHQTRLELPKDKREKVISILSSKLADAIDLAMQCKQAHWNVRGPDFIALHELFDKVAEEVEDHVDELAERITALGGSVKATLRATATQSSMKEYPLEISAGSEHVGALSDALADFGARVRQAIDEADKLGDKGSADLFTQISRSIDKQLWFVEAHDQADS